MEITEVRIKLTADSDDRLQAFCSITFDDCFVIRDLKIIEGANGPFVAMPSRKLTAHCLRCGSKNHLRAAYCNQCGAKQNPDRAPRDAEGRVKLYADIAHPINSQCREMIQQRVISDYRRELDLAKQPGYVSRYDEDYDEDFSTADLPEPEGRAPGTASANTPLEKTQIEPASPGPGPPHLIADKSADDEARDRAPVATSKRDGGFGAGILDD
jgi:stage V sporulation protein G